jgi:hypothetical protein
MSIVDYDKARTWQWLYSRRLDHGTLSDHPLFRQQITYGRDYAYTMQSPWGELTWHTEYWRALTEDHLWHPSQQRAQSFLTIPTDAHLLFVGSGFGFLAEAARSLGWTSVACLDDSNWINDHKADLAYRFTGSSWVQDTPNAVETIIQGDLAATQQIRNALKPIYNNGSGEPDWIITESVVAGLTEPTDPLYSPGEGDANDLTPFLDDCDSLLAPGGTVVHMCDTTIRPPFNVKSLAEWKAYGDNPTYGGPRPNHRWAMSGYFTQDWEIL